MTGQTFMFDVLPAPKARRTDPAVSQQAARYAERFQRTHCGRILAGLQQYGPSTAHELASRIGLDHVAIDRRRKEMVKCGWVRLTGETRGGAEVMEAT